jgi:hypothetical protein
MADRRWYPWVWRDDDGAARYVGVGRMLRGVHPADRIWLDRFKEDDSPLLRWLRERHGVPPRREDVGGADAKTRVEAESLFSIVRQSLQDAGADLLTTREIRTYRHGNGVARVVEDDFGIRWPSLREAARAYNINPSSAQRRVRSGLWRYINEQPTE